RIGQPARGEDVDVPAIIDAAASAYRPVRQAGTLTLTIDAGDAKRWRGDPTDLLRALGNLIDNALRYGASGDGVARIAVQARAMPAGIALSVADQGAGVPPGQLERLVRPFERLDTARGERGGAGLGLAIVERIARRYGGQLSLAAPPGGGLQVRLELPDLSEDPQDRRRTTVA
ncbi:MAG: sensor histidine kinase, partial [Gammaproteobacteria bacterium]